MEFQKRIISVVVINESSVLSRIAGLFSGRGYNITSLTVAPIPDTEYSRITISTAGDKKVIEQIIKQLHKLIPVFKVVEDAELVEQELAMVKVSINEKLSEIDTICKAYNGKIIRVNGNSAIVMATDEHHKISCFLQAMKNYNAKDIVRSGVVAIER